MRTTVNIDDQLLDRAKQLAFEQHRSLGQIIEEALRSILYPSPQSTPKKPTRLRTFGGQGQMPGVDLDNNAALEDLMDGR